ncbi:glycerol-3-phosphate responsive antiterminator [Pseudobacillus badius]|uniref:glycerol-3-phosphate responsive antiterminator n=1 Tax=Bacillus badius TaxID=1455 RepID=UPI0007B0A3AE|nr:glycerol-3-phosphate responsive antiterminator [Bacillus badius]KZO01748.1 glycerol-3-phosphate responsive antiterminator GlpP [Bacillus badius]MED0667408.1 glycerol-3-phosphate responsive antiterminator [Bacillus badius]OCS90141.1 glycerol-3-phosphate responsive antiterminator GlpP [Bacillus badius]OVE53669.1 glycerol-3-phosphate responsive antiterminator GlpP [Bacillus badius]TDW06040.1 glycerol uptake operon antiterminator [Bacillus badius]
MNFHGQKILPAVRTMKDFDKMLETPFEYGVFLDLHVGMVKSVFDYARQHGKKMFLHLDLIHGLTSDEYAAEFIAQYVKPYGIISTKGNAIVRAKQKGLLATQRAFIIDSSALERSIKLIERTDPDYIEVLPGVVPKIIKELHEKTKKPIFAGGLIETREEVEEALEAGACAITTSDRELWKLYY